MSQTCAQTYTDPCNCCHAVNPPPTATFVCSNAESQIGLMDVEEDSVDPDFSFAGRARTLSPQELRELMEQATYSMQADHPLKRALRRGIGVHHSGLPTKYRQVVEILFRCSYLRVVIATGTTGCITRTRTRTCTCSHHAHAVMHMRSCTCGHAVLPFAVATDIHCSCHSSRVCRACNARMPKLHVAQHYYGSSSTQHLRHSSSHASRCVAVTQANAIKACV